MTMSREKPVESDLEKNESNERHMLRKGIKDISVVLIAGLTIGCATAFARPLNPLDGFKASVPATSISKPAVIKNTAYDGVYGVVESVTNTSLINGGAVINGETVVIKFNEGKSSVTDTFTILENGQGFFYNNQYYSGSIGYNFKAGQEVYMYLIDGQFSFVG